MADDKAIWIAEARRALRLPPKDVCDICGKWSDIAQSHHILPLADQWDMGIREPDHRMVWLCPNHHAAIHYVMSQERKMKGNSRLGDLSGAEERELWALYDHYMTALTAVRGND